MRFKTSVTAAAAAGLLALGLTASAAGSAHAAATSLGPGWAPIQLHAYSGNGCAVPQTNTHLAPIISEPCGSYHWYYRFLGANDDEAELVDATGTYALGISGGAWKLETPDASTTWVLMVNGLTGYSTLEDSTRTYGMTPQAKGDAVGLINFNDDGTETDSWDLIS